MKGLKLWRTLTALVLALALVFVTTGCGKIIDNIPADGEIDEDESSLPFPELGEQEISSLATRDFIRLTVEDDLQEAFPDATVDYVDCVYISQEYIEEVYYNSLDNVYFGYDYDEIASYMQGTNWTFTVDENGQTVVTEVTEPNTALVDMIKKVAIGTGVIVICVVITYATGGVGAGPVACFFAGAAKGAIYGAVSGATVSGIIGGVVEGVKTQTWEGALQGAMTSAADGYMWGAISGAMLGGFTSSACFTGDTLVRTESGYKPIHDVSVGECVYSFDEATNSYGLQPVTEISERSVNNLVALSVGGEEIVTTPEHPFYTPDGWVKAKDLSSRSWLLTNEGYVAIDSAESITTEDEVWVYNLTVAYYHTYTVSTMDVVVHNACGDSAKLRQNLIDAGDAVPDYPNAAHHIVPSSDARSAQALQAREKLRLLGIDINDASNGVFLPTSKTVSQSTYHRTLHTAEYYEKVNNMLSSAKNKEQALEVLAEIKSMLMNGTFLP